MIDHSFIFLDSSNWTDYALLDSGDGLKLERFGKYVFVRPESQAMWKRSLDAEWKNAHAVFVPTGEERDRKSTRLNSSHSQISYAVFCLKKKKKLKPD